MFSTQTKMMAALLFWMLLRAFIYYTASVREIQDLFLLTAMIFVICLAGIFSTVGYKRGPVIVLAASMLVSACMRYYFRLPEAIDANTELVVGLLALIYGAAPEQVSRCWNRISQH